MPGATMAVNNTGRPEPVGQQPVHVHLELHSGGHGSLDQALMNWLQRTVRVQGGGDVQLTFGTGY